MSATDNRSDQEMMKQVRRELGETQQELADRLGYSHPKEVSNVERGVQRMSSQTRKALALIEKYET